MHWLKKVRDFVWQIMCNVNSSATVEKEENANGSTNNCNHTYTFSELISWQVLYLLLRATDSTDTILCSGKLQNIELSSRTENGTALVLLSIHSLPWRFIPQIQDRIQEIRICVWFLKESSRLFSEKYMLQDQSMPSTFDNANETICLTLESKVTWEPSGAKFNVNHAKSDAQTSSSTMVATIATLGNSMEADVSETVRSESMENCTLT